MIDTFVVIAKQPRPGRVKTRLTPRLSAAQAADIAAAALTDTLDTVSATPSLHKLLAFDGCADGWLRAGWTHRPQPAGGLDERLAAALVAAARLPAGGPALLVGMDTPQLTPELLTQFDPSRYEACLGPARDGGYWAIGFRDPSVAPRAVLGVPMSVPGTGLEQLRRLRALGLRVQLLPELIDIDTVDDAHTVAALAPHSCFTATLTRIAESAA